MEILNKIKSLFRKKQPYRNISECPRCRSTDLDKIGNDKYCKNCGTIL